MKILAIAIILSLSLCCFATHFKTTKANSDNFLQAEETAQATTSTGVNIYDEGHYLFKNNYWGAYLAIGIDWNGYDGNYDVRGSHMGETFYLRAMSDGYYYLTNGAKYIAIGGSNPYDADITDTNTKLQLIQDSGDIYCIKGVNSGTYLRMYRKTNENNYYVYEVNTQTYCSTYEKWQIILVVS